MYHHLLGHQNFPQPGGSKPADLRILKIRENKKTEKQNPVSSCLLKVRKSLNQKNSCPSKPYTKYSEVRTFPRRQA